MSELPFDQLITALGNWSRGIPDIRAREPEALITRVIDAMTAATQRAEAAEAKYGVANECHANALRLYKKTLTECDALRNVIATMKAIACEACEYWDNDEDNRDYNIRKYFAALAVQPTTGEGA